MTTYTDGQRMARLCFLFKKQKPGQFDLDTEEERNRYAMASLQHAPCELV